MSVAVKNESLMKTPIFSIYLPNAMIHALRFSIWICIHAVPPASTKGYLLSFFFCLFVLLCRRASRISTSNIMVRQTQMVIFLMQNFLAYVSLNRYCLT